MEDKVVKDKNALMVQMAIALGQGCGSAKVSDEACSWFHKQYYDWIDTPKTNEKAGGKKPIDVWDKEGESFFGHFREMGKRAAGESGSEPVSAKTLETHALAVERENDCPWCPSK